MRPHDSLEDTFSNLPSRRQRGILWVRYCLCHMAEARRRREEPREFFITIDLLHVSFSLLAKKMGRDDEEFELRDGECLAVRWFDEQFPSEDKILDLAQFTFDTKKEFQAFDRDPGRAMTLWHQESEVQAMVATLMDEAVARLNAQQTAVCV